MRFKGFANDVPGPGYYAKDLYPENSSTATSLTIKDIAK